jgi:cupin 2 domain-containing protein
MKQMQTPIKSNLFDNLQEQSDIELFDQLIKTPSLLIEKITSTGQATPEGAWYDQVEDEWVVLLKGEATLRFASGEIMELSAGDYLLIPAHCRHRVERTSSTPPCVWLAVHGDLKEVV